MIADNILADSKPLNYFALEKECISLRDFLGEIGNVENYFAHEFCGHVKKELQSTGVELDNAELK